MRKEGNLEREKNCTTSHSAMTDAADEPNAGLARPTPRAKAPGQLS